MVYQDGLQQFRPQRLSKNVEKITQLTCLFFRTNTEMFKFTCGFGVTYGQKNAALFKPSTYILQNEGLGHNYKNSDILMSHI